MNPAQTIKEAREQAEKRLLYELGDKVREICNDFSRQTGFSVDSVGFGLEEVYRLGYQHPTDNPVVEVTIGYRD